MTESLLTVQEVADALRITPRGVRRLIEKGALEGIPVSERGRARVGRWRVSRAELNRFVRSDRSASHPSNGNKGN